MAKKQKSSKALTVVLALILGLFLAASCNKQQNDSSVAIKQAQPKVAQKVKREKPKAVQSQFNISKTPPANTKSDKKSDYPDLYPALEFLRKLPKDEYRKLSALVAYSRAAYIGRVRKLILEEALALNKLTKNPLTEDKLRVLIKSDIWLVLKGDLSSLIKKGGYIYVDRRITDDEINVPALILPISMIYNPQTAKQQLLSPWQIVKEWYFPITPDKFSHTLNSWFDKREEFIINPKSTSPQGIQISLIDFNSQSVLNGRPPMVVIQNNGENEVVFPIVDPQLREGETWRDRIGRAGLYRQIAWFAETNTGEIVAYHRPYAIEEPVAPERLVLRTLSRFAQGKRTQLMFPQKEMLYTLLADKTLFDKYAPIKITTCVVEVMDKQQLLKTFNKQLSNIKPNQLFSGYVCGSTTVKAPIAIPKGITLITGIDFKPLSEMLKAHK